ncbi:MAG: glycerophosphodiester phosphodiesterase [Polyangiaceae bacterium]|jgi:glycerophosphoryl diester phosphodiesterase|nr:glycerophosphodiester phosphodiesterase [Polyangiaceae bacterium]
MIHPFLRDLRPTLLIAHRGGASIAPENTMVAFRLAVERYAADMLELDVRATQDGELVVVHDATLERCTDARGAVTDLTWGDLQTVDAGYGFTTDGGRTAPFRGKGIRIPLLEDVLREFPHVRFNIELKDDTRGLEMALADVVRKTQMVEKVCVGSEHDRVSKWILQALPEACHFYPLQALTNLLIGLKSDTGPHKDDPFLVLDAPLYYGGLRIVDADLVAKARAFGRWVNVWTVDDPSEMQRLVDEGVGGIMTDRPDVLRQVLAGHADA